MDKEEMRRACKTLPSAYFQSFFAKLNASLGPVSQTKATCNVLLLNFFGIFS